MARKKTGCQLVAEIVDIFQKLKPKKGEHSEAVKERIHSLTFLLNDLVRHLLDCPDCAQRVNGFLLGFAHIDDYSKIITPRARKIMAARAEHLGVVGYDSVCLVGIEVPHKGTLLLHDTHLRFVSPLEIHTAVRRFRKSTSSINVPGFSDLGIDPATRLYMMSSQGHYEDHGKMTIIDILAMPPEKY